MKLVEFMHALAVADEAVARMGGNWRVCIFAGCDEPATTYTRDEGISPREILGHYKLLDGYPVLVHQQSRCVDVVSLTSVTHVRAIS